MSKRTKNKVKESKQFSTTDLARALYALSPKLAEAFTSAEIELVIDDAGWMGGVSSTLGVMDRDEKSRYVIMSRARRYWRDDPMAKQAVRVWTDYCFGDTGLTYDSEDEAQKAELDKITKHPLNKKIFNAQGQQRSSKKLLVDGDVYFLVFTGGAVPTLRYLEPMQMKKKITDPDDEETTLGYRRMTSDGKKLYYRDWTNEDAAPALDPDTKSSIKWQKDVVCYQASFDQFGQFGNGLLNSVVDWTKENRRFMTARVAIIEALSKFAYKTGVKGGQATLNAMKTKLESSFVQTGLQGGPERNPSTAPGGNWLQNAGMDLTPIPRATGAGDAKQDSDILKLMISAGTGIMLHYFGDPSTGNLATATAMELPMLKQFAGYQQLWKDVYRDLFGIMLGETPEDPIEDLTLELPPILDEDLQSLSAFLTALTTVFPEAKQPEILERCLIAMGVENVDELADAIKKTKAENDANAAAIQKAALTAPKPPVAGDPALAKAQESYDAMTRAIAELSAKL